MAVAGDVSDGVFLCCLSPPRDVLDEIWDLIESGFEGFPTYSSLSGPSDRSTLSGFEGFPTSSSLSGPSDRATLSLSLSLFDQVAT